MTTVHLTPAPIPSGGVQRWCSSGRSLSSALSPSNAEVSVFVAPKAYSTAQEVDEDGTASGSGGKRQNESVPPKVSGVFEQDRAVYFGKWATVDAGLNQLYADSYMIFKTAQELHLLSVASSSTLFPIATSHSTSTFPASTSSSISGTPQPHQSHIRKGDPFITSSTNIQSKFMGSVVPAPKMRLKGGKGRVKGHRGMMGIKPGVEATKKYRLICDEYAWRLMVVARDSSLDLATRSKHASIHQILQLAAMLYIPADGSGFGLIGEEMLYYYNEYADPEGTRELREMTERAMLRERSWEEEDYLEAIMRSIVRGIPNMAILLLKELVHHPQPSIWAFAELLIHALESLPRSNATSSPGSHRPKYLNEAIFFQAHQQWRSTLRSDVSVTCRGLEQIGGWLEFEDDIDVMIGQDQGDPTSWENFFVQAIDVLLGKEEKVLEWADGWKGATGIWGVLVDVSVKRDDLPSVMQTIWETLPADLTSSQESIETSLLRAEVTKALIHCNDYDLWLAAHLTDVLDKMLIVEDDEIYPISLRDYLILSYTDTLQAVPQYWNIAVGYLATCGREGFGRIREVVVRVGIDGSRGGSSDGADPMAWNGDTDMNGNGLVDGHVNVNSSIKGKGKENPGLTHERLKAVLEVCAEHNLDEELREICRSAAAILLIQRRYGEALSYCIRGILGDGDFSQLATITDAVLDVYVREGSEQFLAAVDSISPTLMRASREEQLNPQPDDYLYPTAAYDYQDPNSGTSSRFSLFDGGHHDEFGQSILGELDEGSKKRLRFLGRYRDFLLALAEEDQPSPTTPNANSGHEGDEVDAFGMDDDEEEQEEVPRSAKQRAADQVVYMASRGLVPRRFWAVFLTDCIPLLEDEDILFSETDTYELMRLMEEVTIGSGTAPEEYLSTLLDLTKPKSASTSTAPPQSNGHARSNGIASELDQDELRFLKSRAEREKIDSNRKGEMIKALKGLNAFKLAALRNLGRTMSFVNLDRRGGR